jgi:hypothetical protein
MGSELRCCLPYSAHHIKSFFISAPIRADMSGVSMLIVLMCHSGALVLHITPKRKFKGIMSVTVEAVYSSHPVQSNTEAILGSETHEQLTSTAVGHHPFAGKLKAVVILFLVQHNNF